MRRQSKLSSSTVARSENADLNGELLLGALSAHAADLLRHEIESDAGRSGANDYEELKASDATQVRRTSATAAAETAANKAAQEDLQRVIYDAAAQERARQEMQGEEMQDGEVSSSLRFAFGAYTTSFLHSAGGAAPIIEDSCSRPLVMLPVTDGGQMGNARRYEPAGRRGDVDSGRSGSVVESCSGVDVVPQHQRPGTKLLNPKLSKNYFRDKVRARKEVKRIGQL